MGFNIFHGDRELHTLKISGVFWLLIIFSLILFAVAVVVFGNKNSVDSAFVPEATESQEALADARQSRIYTVNYRNGVFSPTNLRIRAGDTVRFKNEGFIPIHVMTDSHPEHKNLIGFDSVGDIPQGSYFSYTFATQGIFGYHNERKPEETGTIIVR